MKIKRRMMSQRFPEQMSIIVIPGLAEGLAEVQTKG